jgi:hypothetical protein
MMRVDGIFFGNQNASDPSLPLTPGTQISITDFSVQGPPVNTYSGRSYIDQTPTCVVGPGFGFIIPSPDYLTESKAIWAGTEEWVGVGTVQQWTVLNIVPNTIVTFFWTQPKDDSTPLYLGWDLVSLFFSFFSLLF